MVDKLYKTILYFRPIIILGQSFTGVCYRFKFSAFLFLYNVQRKLMYTPDR